MYFSCVYYAFFSWVLNVKDYYASFRMVAYMTCCLICHILKIFFFQFHYVVAPLDDPHMGTHHIKVCN